MKISRPIPQWSSRGWLAGWICAVIVLAGVWTAACGEDAKPADAQAAPAQAAPAPAAQAAVKVQAVRRVFVNGFAFGGDDGDDDDNAAAAAAAAGPDPAGSHLLEFTDGSHLHGTLTTLDTAAGQLAWQRADASAALAFPLADIGRLTLHAGAKPEASKAHATVKLTGGDWLAADVTGLTDKKIQLKLGDGSPLTIDREKVEWIYFAKNGAPECYDGPTSLAGWSSGGGWEFRNGALRATMPAMIGRSFEALPDQVEYFLEVDQGAAGHAFTFMLHNDVLSRGRTAGTIQMMFRGSEIRMWMQQENQTKSEQIDLTKLLPELNGNGVADKKTVQFRVLEDYTGGRLLVFVNGRKAAEWETEKGRAGENHGGVSFQPQGWNPASEQVISQFRVIPWDGRVPKDDAPAEAAAKTDLVSFGDGEAKAGTIEGMTGEHVKLHPEGGGTVEVPRAKIVMLHFHRTEHPADEDPPVAHVQLAQRGEFDVAGLVCRQGRFTMRTNFGGELALTAAALRAVEFSRAPWSPPKPADELVFHNGDRLRGTLESAADGSRLRWQAAHAEAPVEFDLAGLAGVAFAPPAEPPEAKTALVARLRNGDTLGGTLVKCDAGNLVLDSAPAGQFTVARDQVQALYFANDGKLPVLDGAARRDSWSGVENEFNQSGQVDKKKSEAAKLKRPSAWHSFDGAFTYSPFDSGQANAGRTGTLRLATDFDTMPQLVELAFDVIFPKPSVAFSAQFFFDDNNPGYLLQLYRQGLYLYDMGARQQLRGAVQQQFQFGDKLPAKARQRHLRVLADRHTGKIIIVVDGVVIGQMAPKAGGPPRNLGQNVQLTSSLVGPCTFANLWIGPWNGQPPDLAPAPDAPPHTVLLANGDETHGTVGEITAEAAKIESEAGAIELPTARLVAIDFAGAPAAAPAGTRVRFADWGALTVKSFRVEKDEVVCASSLAGELKLPRSAVRELIFPAPAEKPAAEKKREP